MENLEIRESAPRDLVAIEALYPDAFPDEDLLPLVRALLQEPNVVLSLIAKAGGSLVGHVAFTQCAVDGGESDAALLGPLAVAPAAQRQGVGGALVRAGLERLKDAGVRQIFVLGDPNYYGRFGFKPRARVAPPYPIPAEWRDAWQSMPLGDADTAQTGKLSVPKSWRDPVLWAS